MTMTIKWGFPHLPYGSTIVRVGDEGTPRVLLIEDPPASLPITILQKALFANTISFLACEQGWNQLSPQMLKVSG